MVELTGIEVIKSKVAELNAAKGTVTRLKKEISEMKDALRTALRGGKPAPARKPASKPKSPKAPKPTTPERGEPGA